MINMAKKGMRSWLKIDTNMNPVSMKNQEIHIPTQLLTLQLFRHQSPKLWCHCVLIFIHVAYRVHSSEVVFAVVNHRAINMNAPNVRSIFVASVLSTLNKTITRMVLQEWQRRIVFTFQLAAWAILFSNILIGTQPFRWTAFSVKMLSWQ